MKKGPTKSKTFICFHDVPTDIAVTELRLHNTPPSFMVCHWQPFTRLLLKEMLGKKFHFSDEQRKRISPDFILKSVESIHVYENETCLVCTFKTAPPRGWLERLGLIEECPTCPQFHNEVEY